VQSMSDEDTGDGRRSVLFMPPSLPDGGDAHLFLRDFDLELSRLEEHLEVELADNAQSDAVAEFLGREGPYESVDDIVARFVESCAGRLAAYGEAWFETVQSGRARPVLVSMPPYRFTSVGTVVIQHIPRAERKRLRRRHVVLPRASVVRICLPAHLGSARRHLRLLRSLADPSSGLPAFVLQRDQRVPFDLEDYSAIRDRHLARATRHWGWNEGLRSSDATTEFFNVYRRLRFARSRSILVGHVIAEMNSLFIRHALRAKVTLRPEFRPEAFDDAAVRLKDGHLSLMDAVKVGVR